MQQQHGTCHQLSLSPGPTLPTTCSSLRVCVMLSVPLLANQSAIHPLLLDTSTVTNLHSTPHHSTSQHHNTSHGAVWAGKQHRNTVQSLSALLI